VGGGRNPQPRDRDPSTSQTDSLCESVCCAQDDRTALGREKRPDEPGPLDSRGRPSPHSVGTILHLTSSHSRGESQNPRPVSAKGRRDKDGAPASSPSRRDPSTSQIDSLCESVCYAQDDRAFLILGMARPFLVSREIVVKRQNCGWRGYVVANEGGNKCANYVTSGYAL
jgi:hypothetical protein